MIRHGAGAVVRSPIGRLLRRFNIGAGTPRPRFEPPPDQTAIPFAILDNSSIGDRMDISDTMPQYRKDAFYCPFCGTFAKQEWIQLFLGMSIPTPTGWKPHYEVIGGGEAYAAKCHRCGNLSIWLDKQRGMIYPATSLAPLPTADMPENVRADFEEARRIANASPRAAAALLRLALQKLMRRLGLPGEKLDQDIGSLVAQGLDRDVQQALDTIRVIGNESVHPGTIDLRDNPETALVLFKILNYIVRVMITDKAEARSLYDSLPKSKRDGIETRDSK
jgi:hypothetical protein